MICTMCLSIGTTLSVNSQVYMHLMILLLLMTREQQRVGYMVQEEDHSQHQQLLKAPNRSVILYIK